MARHTPPTLRLAAVTTGSGNYVVYSGSGNSVNLTGLLPETTYHFAVFEFNGSAGTENYLTASPATGSQQTMARVAWLLTKLILTHPEPTLRNLLRLWRVGNAPLDGYATAFYNGSNDQAYAAFDLDGQTTNANGYFVLGNSAVPAAGNDICRRVAPKRADAVALFQANDTDFPNGTAVTTTNLRDALVYDTDDADDPGLLALLNASEPQVNENERSDSADHSMQRCPDGTGGGEYPTHAAISTAAGTINVCTPFPDITFGPAPTATYLGGDFTVSASTTNTDDPTFTYSKVSGPLQPG